MQVVFVLFYFWQKNKKQLLGKFLLGVSIGVGLTMIATGSRASVLGSSVGFLFLLFCNSRIEKSALSTIWTVFFISITIYLIIGYFLPSYSGGLFREETSGRLTLWERGWNLYKEGPFWGTGFGGKDDLSASVASSFKPISSYAPSTHNSYLRLLLDLGLTGVVFVLFAFSVLLYRAWKHLKYFEDPHLGAVLFTIITASLTNAFFESWLFGFGNSVTVPFWLFLGMLTHQTDMAAVRVKHHSAYMAQLRLAQRQKTYEVDPVQPISFQSPDSP